MNIVFKYFISLIYLCIFKPGKDFLEFSKKTSLDHKLIFYTSLILINVFFCIIL